MREGFAWRFCGVFGGFLHYLKPAATHPMNGLSEIHTGSRAVGFGKGVLRMTR